MVSHKENRTRLVPGIAPVAGKRARRRVLAVALTLALAADGALAGEMATDLRQDVLAHLAGQPLPPDMSWEQTVHLDALARHHGWPSPVSVEGRATIPVTNCNDSGTGSLRQAIAIAGNNDTIDASGLTCSSITLSNGALAVAQQNLFIQGPGRDALTIRPATKYRRVITHTGTGTLSITGVTLANGSTTTNSNQPDARGGCVFSEGFVMLGNLLAPSDPDWGVTVAGCSAISTQAGVTAQGGGVFATRGLALYASTISGCTAQATSPATYARGGGAFSGASVGPEFTAKYSQIIDNDVLGSLAKGGGVATGGLSGDITIENSTIAGNHADGSMGGAYLWAANTSDVTISNSTISGNAASTIAGLKVNTVSSALGPGRVRVRASTITANNNTTMAQSAGISVLGPLEITSTIVSGNTFNGSSFRDFTQTDGVLTGSDNLIGFALTTPPPAGLIVSVDPGLAPLDSNGGPTRTHALLPHSLARNAGNNVGANDYDQRGSGYPRVVGVRADIGALEAPADRIFANGFEPP